MDNNDISKIDTFDEVEKDITNEDSLIEHEIVNLISETEGVKSKKDALYLVFDAVESTVGGILITDRKGIITYTNNSFLKMFDYDNKEEVLGHDASEFFSSRAIGSFSDVMTLIDLATGDSEEFSVSHKDGSTFFVEVSASSVRNQSGVAVGLMASFVDITRRKVAEDETEKLLIKLQGALKKIEKLQGLIPICSSCKKIRDDKGYWHQIEEYIHEHSGADFSHGMCNECADKAYGDQPWYQKVRQARQKEEQSL